eukprot:TRINITY_DN65657_c1_g1_i1.p2 TRINITY_DN65657_c1_g1~~TRINITY_DN65657_c1_g1_i1.p2  ORF type:complete len:145 (-),score=0.92 TRINITY_DN65657_c1_g1_i1:333-767(-)
MSRTLHPVFTASQGSKSGQVVLPCGGGQHFFRATEIDIHVMSQHHHHTQGSALLELHCTLANLHLTNKKVVLLVSNILLLYLQQRRPAHYQNTLKTPMVLSRFGQEDCSASLQSNGLGMVTVAMANPTGLSCYERSRGKHVQEK